jgi:hypothetical protein
MFGVAEKLGENPVYGCQRRKLKKMFLSFSKQPKFGFKEF